MTVVMSLALAFAAVAPGAALAKGHKPHKHKSHPAVIRGDKGDRGPQGATGLAGKDGANGVPGANGTNGTNGSNGATNVVVRNAIQAGVPAGTSSNQVTAHCNATERATGGGAAFFGPSSNDTITYSFPSNEFASLPNAGDTPTAWAAKGFNASASAKDFFVFVICASP